MEETRVLTIVFTDIKGFTERTSNSDREAVSRLLKKHEELLLPLAKSYNGVLIKTIGDAFLLSFASPTNAVLCAVMMQEKLKEFNASVSETEKIEVRIAMNTGEVIMRDGDVYGEPVNVASRIESLTDANEVWFSESTYLAMNRQEVPTSLIGEYRLKGIPEAVRVYRVVRDDNSESYTRTVKSQLEKIKSMLAETIVPTAAPRSARALYFLGLVILLTLAFFMFKETALDKQLRLAREAISGKDYRGAVESLKKAVQLQPAASATTQLIRQAVNSHVTHRLAVGEKTPENLSELEEFVKEARTTFSSLDAQLLDCEIELAIQRASLLAAQRQRDEADALLNDLAKRSGNRGDILFTIAKFYSRLGYNWTHTVRYMHMAALTDPASFAANPDVLKEFEWFLQKVAPNDGYDEVRSFIATHCFDHFVPMLQEALYKPGEEYHVLRLNSRHLLSQKGTSIDETGFYLVDLLTSPGNRNSKELTETLNYFIENATNAIILKEVAAQLASYPAVFTLFEKYSYDKNDPETQVIAGPFFDHFKEYLSNRLTSDDIHQRINAHNVLGTRSETSPTELWQYHIRNLADFKSMQWSSSYVPALLESVDYLIKNPLPTKLSDSESHAVIGQKAARAASEILEQVKQAIEDNQDTAFIAPGKRKLADLEKLANLLQKTFPRE
ncbi:MAG: adenylate/guanylate cyclase domain-containing protein [Candidatus Riflebacteria bacterium]|nr:adenylate/guanylate cyclase domain-containing protein [Candidatus Riflebacteria bacterium]